jgi:CHASE2 domain-containing sensor protein
MSTPANNPQQNLVLKSLLTGLLVTLIILSIKWLVEHSQLYRGIQGTCYAWLQTKLSPPRRRADLPVVVLDIRDLEYETAEVQGKKFNFTPRGPLLELIEVVAAQKPKAIAVDIDFSPNEFGFIQPKDPTFFRTVLQVSQQNKIPIFLGTRRSQAKSVERWLGDSEFKSLAVNIYVSPRDRTRMSKWLRRDSQDAGASNEIGNTMSGAIAQAFNSNERQPVKWLDWAVRPFSEREIEPGLTGGEFLVDFSSLEALEDTRLKTKQPSVINDQGWTLTQKAVLIGDGTRYDARDEFPVPRLDRSDPVPGVYLHACAANTLIKNPLYELTALGRFGVDLLLSLSILLCIAIVRWYVTRQKAGALAKRTAQYFFTFIMTVIALTVGIVFVQLTRVIWDDFLFVVLALWIHPSFESILGKIWKGKSNVPKFVQNLFTERG